MIPSISDRSLMDVVIWGVFIIALIVQYAFVMLGGYLHTLLVSLWQHRRLRRTSGDIDDWLESLRSDRTCMYVLYGALVIFLLLILILRQTTVGIVYGTSDSWAWGWIWVFATPTWAAGALVAIEVGVRLAIKSLERQHSRQVPREPNAPKAES